MNKEILASFNALRNYCERESFKGYDPYDGLNSKVFQAIPFFRKSRFARLLWIQAFKRSPVNFRPLFLVEKDYNPKGLALFLSGYCNLFRIEEQDEHLRAIKFLVDKILSLKSAGWSGACWGYNFDWQARAFFQPKFTPTVVASTFVGYALLDAYDILRDEKLLFAARSTCDFILQDLNRTYDKNGNFSFSYSPHDKTQVFNASLLGSRLLSRVYHYTGEDVLLKEAAKSVAFCCSHQKPDGSWSYGTLPFHQWIDNFHTGYNLECIGEYQKYSSDRSFSNNIDIGLRYYLMTFFTEQGIPKYYSDKVYPIDVHATAQLVVTLVRLGVLPENQTLMEQVINWTINNMQSSRGYFYYQKNKYFTCHIPYMRWAQSWMFFGLSEYLKATQNDK